jgi:hypothetical protein
MGIFLVCVLISLGSGSYFMKHQRSPRAQSLLKVGAYHFLFNCLLGSAVVACFSYMIFRMSIMAPYDEKLVYLSVGGVAAWIISVGAFFSRGFSLKCPLCMNPVWGKRMCQKHPKAKRALGVSYRLGIATSVVFKNRYRCPYCGEPFSAEKTKGPKPEKRDRRVRSIR